MTKILFGKKRKFRSHLFKPDNSSSEYTAGSLAYLANDARVESEGNTREQLGPKACAYERCRSADDNEIFAYVNQRGLWPKNVSE